MMKFIREEDFLFHASNRPHKYVRIENGRYIYPEDLERRARQQNAIKRNAEQSRERGRKASKLGRQKVIETGQNIETWQRRDHAHDVLMAPARGYKAIKRGVKSTKNMANDISDLINENKKIIANKESIRQQKDATAARRREAERKRKAAEDEMARQLIKEAGERYVRNKKKSIKNMYKDYYKEYEEPIRDIKRLKNKIKKRIK